MICHIILDESIKALRHDKAFMAKAEHSFLNSQSYSKRFVFEHRVYKFCQRADGGWKLYREDGVRAQTQTLEA